MLEHTIGMGLAAAQAQQYFGWLTLTFLFFDQIDSNLDSGSHSGPDLTFWSNFDILAILTPFWGSKTPKLGQNGQFLTFRDFRPKLGWSVIRLAQIDNLAKF